MSKSKQPSETAVIVTLYQPKNIKDTFGNLNHKCVSFVILYQQKQIIMEQQMDNLFKKLQLEMQNQTIELNATLTANLTSTIEEKIKPLVEQNQVLKDEVQLLRAKVKSLEKESRGNNLILHGIMESERSNTELLDLVLDTLNEALKDVTDKWDKWEISKVQRLGAKKSETKARPILVTLTLIWRKIEILKNNKSFSNNIYATEDFPKDVIIKRRELAPKLQEERKKGKIAYIRYDQLIVKENISEKRKRSPTESPEAQRTAEEAPSRKQPNKINKTNYLHTRFNSNSTTGKNKQ